jgi:hypothetical protein
MATTPARGLLLRLLPVLIALTLIGAARPAPAPADIAAAHGVCSAAAEQDPADEPEAQAQAVPDGARVLGTQVIAAARGSRAPPFTA